MDEILKKPLSEMTDKEVTNLMVALAEELKNRNFGMKSNEKVSDMVSNTLETVFTPR